MNMELKYPLCNIQTDQAGTLEFSISMCKETLVSRCGLSLDDIEHFLQDLQNEISNFKSVMEILQRSDEQVIKMSRVYDQWPGRPKGIPEDPARCVASVPDETGWHFYQCSRKRGHGPNGEYCKQHAKKFPSSDKTEEVEA